MNDPPSVMDNNLTQIYEDSMENSNNKSKKLTNESVNSHQSAEYSDKFKHFRTSEELSRFDGKNIPANARSDKNQSVEMFANSLAAYVTRKEADLEMPTEFNNKKINFFKNCEKTDHLNHSDDIFSGNVESFQTENPLPPLPTSRPYRLNRKVHPAMRRANSLISPNRRLSFSAVLISDSPLPEESTQETLPNVDDQTDTTSIQTYDQMLKLNDSVGTELTKIQVETKALEEDRDQVVATRGQVELGSILAELADNVQTLLEENRNWMQNLRNYGEPKSPETSTHLKAEYSAKLKDQLDSHESRLNSILKEYGNSSETSEIENNLRDKLNQTLGELQNIQNNLNSDVDELERKSSAENLVVEKLKITGQNLNEELQILKKTNRALEHSRMILKIRKILENHRESDRVAEDLECLKSENWFRKRTSFQADGHLIQEKDELINNNSKDFDRFANRIPEEWGSFWGDSIERSDSIVSSDEEEIKENSNSTTRRVSFQDEVQVFQEQEKNRRSSKWNLNIEKNFSKIKKSVKETNDKVIRKLSNESGSSKNESPTEQLPPPFDSFPKHIQSHLLKIIFIGDTMVGKTSFICRAIHEILPEGNSISTIGIDFKSKVVAIEEDIYMVQLWDTAGQERFRSISMNYFRKVDAICLMYDVTNVKSFLSVRRWVDSIMDTIHTRPIPLMIVANKIDIRDNLNELLPTSKLDKFVTTRDGHELIRSLHLGTGCQFVETSVYDGTNIEDIVVEIVKMIRWNWKENAERRELESSVGIQLGGSEAEKKKKSFCC